MTGSAPPTSSGRPPAVAPRALALAAICLGATLVVFPAITVFLGNVLELPFSLMEALPYLTALGAAIAVAAFLMLLLARGPLRARGAALALGLAVAAWIQANLLTWDYGVFDGSSIPWDRYARRGLVDLALWLAIPGLFLLRWRAASRYAADVALGLLSVQLAGSLIAAASADVQPSYLRTVLDPVKRFRLSAGRNVIVIVLDGAQSSEFSRVLQEQPALRAAFDGFTYFRNAVADFPLTQASLPALLTAQRYDNSLPYASFVEQAYLTRSSLPLALRRAGFLVDLYALRRAIRWDDRVVSNLRARGGLAGPLATLLDVAAFRVAPQALKRVVYADQRWCARRMVGWLGLESQPPAAIADGISDNVEFVESFEGEAAHTGVEAAPVFKLFHLAGPHPPLTVNERGEREQLPYSPENYRRALTGVTRLTASLLDTLRREGLLDRSLVLIVSDHGHYVPVAPTPDVMPAGASPTEFPRALALVLVKPVSSRGPLRLSDAPVQLSDVPKTVLVQLGLDTAGVEGSDMFALAADSPRVRTFRAMVDTHWRQSRRLPPMTEYAVSGFSWLRSSWSATGRTFGSYGEALEVFRKLEHKPFLGELTAHSNRGTLPGMAVNNEGELMVFFPTPDPEQGDVASVSLPIEHLARGHRYRLALEILDRCPLRYPGRFVQTVWLEDRLLDSHDLAADEFVGSRRIECEFQARSSRATLKAELRVVGPVDKGGSWGAVAHLGLRRLTLDDLAVE